MNEKKNTKKIFLIIFNTHNTHRLMSKLIFYKKKMFYHPHRVACHTWNFLRLLKA